MSRRLTVLLRSRIKNVLALHVFLLCSFLNKSLQAQLRIPVIPDSLFSTYYHQRVTHFRKLPQTAGDIVFIGNSITDGVEWSELFDDKRIKNRGISGDITAGVINRIDEVTGRKPAKIFLMIGVNDLARKISADSVLKNMFWIASYIKQQTPATQLYMQSILPINDIYKKFGTHTDKGEQIKKVNAQLQKSAAAYHYTYIDLHRAFSDGQGKMDASLTNDGLHLKGEAYLLWKHLIYPFVFDVQPKASLLPLPQQLQWEHGYFKLFAAKTIVVNDSALQKEATRLKEHLSQRGLHLNIGSNAPAEPFIELRLGKMEAPQLKEEAYRLKVTSENVTITANTPHGIYNGIQTLIQLARDGVMLDACTITDYPAFSWRGYMIDVGRNYQSVALLKQQVDAMAIYKLNIFHFHATEDIAWRLQIPGYPQLNAQETALRNKGAYYTVAELKDLIQYCKERYITLVPEIDRPGHSAAFTRAMGVEMQSEKGLLLIRDILAKFCKTYEVPYLHIGGDEVKISNKNFLPEVSALLQNLGKELVGWEPGGNFTDNTLRQLWMADAGRRSSNPDIRYIDSRHLYLNHMDPLESVVTIFNRQIGDVDVETKNVLGGTICMWPDRRVEQETDVLKMNPVYPAMLAFAERSWRGGGRKGWVANIGAPQSIEATEFAQFENRLLDHKKQNFFKSPFPYMRQSEMTWTFYGPYQNDGDLSKSFAPERSTFDETKTNATTQAVGGTIVMRHWWYPLIKGLLETPKENTTWYAATKIWSDANTVMSFWIGFNNLSRSPATDSPQWGTWDNHQSKVSVNEKVIEPPEWKHGGQKGHSEIPLVDEGYEYRAPTKITLHKGWNAVLIKLPIGTFKGKDWQNPVKWMFTFVPVNDGE